MEDEMVASRVFVLPPELLGNIFSQVSEESPLELSSSLFVCRTWHAFIVNDPTLWAAITLNSRICAHLIACLHWGAPPNQKMARVLSFYDACIRLSKLALLKITLDLESFSGWGDKHTFNINLIPLLTLFMTKTGKYATRWKEFIWKHHDPLFSAIYIIRRLPQRLPSLQRLTITQLHCHKHWERLYFPTCPNVQTVSFINVWDEGDREVPALFQQNKFSSVRDLTLGRGWNWQNADLRYVAMFRNIHTLTLSSLSQQTNGKIVFTSRIFVTLPRLRLLRLHGRIPSEILSSIKPPDCLTVAVGDSDGTGWVLHSIDTLSGTMVATKMTILRLEWPDRGIKVVPLGSVFKLLNSAPCLEVVYLSPRAAVMLEHEFEVFKASYGYSFSICADGV